MLVLPLQDTQASSSACPREAGQWQGPQPRRPLFPRKQPVVEEGLLAEACGTRTLDPFGGGIPFSEHLERTLHALRDFFFLNFEN